MGQMCKRVESGPKCIYMLYNVLSFYIEKLVFNNQVLIIISSIYNTKKGRKSVVQPDPTHFKMPILTPTHLPPLVLVC